MIASWLASLWAKAGAWLALAGAVAAAVLAAAVWGEHKGKQVGVADAARQAVADAKAAQQTTLDAAKAVERVQADAAKQPLPDPVKRNDLDNTF